MLLVERKEFDINCTRAFVNGRRLPINAAVKVQCCFGHQCAVIFAVDTFEKLLRLLNWCVRAEQVWVERYLLKRIMSGIQMFDEGIYMDVMLLYFNGSHFKLAS